MIFENGYLKDEYLNKQYRGIVGWPAEFWTGLHVEPDAWHKGILICMYNEIAHALHTTISCDYEQNGCRFGKYPRIKEFTKSGIPLGELCWIRVAIGDDDCWELRSLLEIDVVSGIYNIVPHLIANTKEDAEDLKRWKVI